MNGTDKATQAAEAGVVQKLRVSLRVCEEKLRAFRNERRAAISQYVGAHYGGVAMPTLPMNVLAGVVLSMVPNLVGGSTKALCRGRTREANRMAPLLALDLDDWSDEIGWDERLRLTVLDAMFGPAMMWTGVAPGEQYDVEDVLLDAGTVVAERVSLDDYRLDPQARSRTAALYEGHVTELPLAYVMDSAVYRNKDHLFPSRANTGEKRVSGLSGESEMPGPVETVRPIELYLPRGFDGRDRALLVTLPPDGMGDLPLRIEDWQGPEEGPYDDLTFHDVPDNALGLAPVALYVDLHLEINRFVRKMLRQADREKVLTVVEDVAAADGITIRSAEDGQIILVKNKDRVGTIQTGGLAQGKAEVLSALLAFFSRQAGNSDLIGGIRPAAPTLGQEELLSANADIRVEDMRQRVRRFKAAVYRKVAEWRYADPMHAPTLTRRLPETDLEVNVPWTPELRAESSFDQLKVDVQAFSRLQENPDHLAARIINWVNTVALPLSQLAAAQGATLDAEEIMRLTARLQGIEEVDDLVLGGAVGMGIETPNPATQAAQPAGSKSVRGQRGTPNANATPPLGAPAAANRPVATVSR